MGALARIDGIDAGWWQRGVQGASVFKNVGGGICEENGGCGGMCVYVHCAASGLVRGANQVEWNTREEGKVIIVYVRPDRSSKKMWVLLRCIAQLAL